MGTKKLKKQTAGEILKEAGATIKLARFQQEKQLKAFAVEAEVSEPTISNLEKGRLENISLENLVKIANSLGLKIAVIIE